MSRILAVLVAVGMVAGAVYIRGRIDDDDGNGSGSGDGNGQLVCDPVLEAACRAVTDDVVVEDAATTAERLLDADRFEGDGWATPGPWPAMVDELRETAGRTPLFGDGGRVVASSRVALVGPAGDLGPWRAVGDAVAAGDLRLGWRDPASGLGVLQLAAFAVGYFEGPDFATNDFDDPMFTSYLEGIEEEAEVARDPLERRLQQGISFAEAVVSFQGEADRLLDEAAPGRRGDLRPLYPEPVVAVEAVLVGDDDLAGDLAGELSERGWPGGVATNLPSPGVLAALWQEVRR
jgi:hypothetical protein